MKLYEYIRNGAWPTVVGYGLFVALLAAGYYYNITFVQLGLLDLGTRHVGLTRTGVSTWMAVLAVVIRSSLSAMAAVGAPRPNIATLHQIAVPNSFCIISSSCDRVVAIEYIQRQVSR